MARKSKEIFKQQLDQVLLAFFNKSLKWVMGFGEKPETNRNGGARPIQ